MKKEQSIEDVKNAKKKKEIQKAVGDFTLEVTPRDFLTGEEMETKTCYLTKPSRSTLSKALNMLTPTTSKQEPDMIGAGNIVLNECFVGGDQSILTNEDYTISASLELLKMVQIADSNLKKN